MKREALARETKKIFFIFTLSFFKKSFFLKKNPSKEKYKLQAPPPRYPADTNTGTSRAEARAQGRGRESKRGRDPRALTSILYLTARRDANFFSFFLPPILPPPPFLCSFSAHLMLGEKREDGTSSKRARM